MCTLASSSAPSRNQRLVLAGSLYVYYNKSPVNENRTIVRIDANSPELAFFYCIIFINVEYLFIR